MSNGKNTEGNVISSTKKASSRSQYDFDPGGDRGRQSVFNRIQIIIRKTYRRR